MEVGGGLKQAGLAVGQKDEKDQNDERKGVAATLGRVPPAPDRTGWRGRTLP